jgi:drug/metabolite transporter (DMT)-like permease
MCRLWIGVGISSIVMAVTKRSLSVETLLACALGGVLFAADIGLSFTAVKHTTIADVALITALAPVVIMLVSAYRLHERVTARSWLLVVASFAGVVIVVLASAGQPSWSLGGDALAAIGIVTWSSYWFFSRHVRDRVDPIVFFACVQLVAAFVMTPFALVVEGTPDALDGRNVFALVTVALFTGFIGHTLVIWSHRHVASWLSALITQISPVITVVLAWLILGEGVSLVAAIGAALAVGATMAVIALDARDRREESAAARVS